MEKGKQPPGHDSSIQNELRENTLTKLLKKCDRCNNYTLKAKECPACKGPVVNAHPARFSIEDRYGSYRRKMKKELLSTQSSNGETPTS